MTHPRRSVRLIVTAMAALTAHSLSAHHSFAIYDQSIT
jgi:hypothetical protein